MIFGVAILANSYRRRQPVGRYFTSSVSDGDAGYGEDSAEQGSWEALGGVVVRSHTAVRKASPTEQRWGRDLEEETEGATWGFARGALEQEGGVGSKALWWDRHLCSVQNSKRFLDPSSFVHHVQPNTTFCWLYLQNIPTRSHVSLPPLLLPALCSPHLFLGLL